MKTCIHLRPLRDDAAVCKICRAVINCGACSREHTDAKCRRLAPVPAKKKRRKR